MSSNRRIRRTISSRSELKQPSARESLTTLMEAMVAEDEKDFEMGDSEFVIEYANVPRKMLTTDFIHSVFQFRFGFLFLFVMAILFIFILIFAIVYKIISVQCGLGIESSLNDAWLFTIFIHFKTALGPPVDPPTAGVVPDGTFWNGCTGGVFGLFGQLFVGNILMSILFSSLVFNFQSFHRRTRRVFNAITLSKTAQVKMCDNKFVLSVQVAEKLIENSHLQSYNVSANVFAIRPPSRHNNPPPVGEHLFYSQVFDDNPIRCIAHNVPLFVTTPGEIFAPIPTDFFSSIRQFPFCPVCGADHCDEHQDKLPPTETTASVAKMLQQKRIQFLVIVEGTDPVSNDRIQVQKIYRNTLITSDNRAHIDVMHFSKTDRAAVIHIDYNSFL